MNEPARIFEEPVDVEVKLIAMGLTSELLRGAVREGQAFVDACTKHDPPAGIGMLGWMKTVRALRDRLVMEDWTYSDYRGYAITTHPNGQWSIAVCGGTSSTGRSDQNPTNRAEKGIAAKEAVRDNIQTHFSRIDPFNFPVELSPSAPAATWMLLSYPDEKAGEIRVELSLARHMDAAGFVTSWTDRIIVEPASYGPVPQPLVGQNDDDNDDSSYAAPISRKEQTG